MKHTSQTITEQNIRQVARLARLTLSDESITQHAQSLSNILDMVAHINDRDTSGILPMASPFADAALYLRKDEITETNQRDIAQTLTASTESGLYLVPKVID